MGFEESALTRLRRYREEADRSLEIRRNIEETAHRFSERLFAGLEYAAELGRRAGFGTETERAFGALVVRVEAAPGTEARLTLGLSSGAAAEMDEDLMHEDLSRYSLDPSGYSGRILGWSEDAGEEPCQIFAVYGDGVWKKTKGLFVAKARGRMIRTTSSTAFVCGYSAGSWTSPPSPVARGEGGPKPGIRCRNFFRGRSIPQ